MLVLEQETQLLAGAGFIFDMVGERPGVDEVDDRVLLLRIEVDRPEHPPPHGANAQPVRHAGPLLPVPLLRDAKVPFPPSGQGVGGVSTNDDLVLLTSRDFKKATGETLTPKYFVAEFVN